MAISAEQFIQKSCREVEIVGFEPDEKIPVKLRTLSILGLVTQGKIPNALMSIAMELFEGKSSHKSGEDGGQRIMEMTKIMEIICENALVEPTYAEIGDYLSDEQKTEIFYYVQGGLRQLEYFREKQGIARGTNDGTDVQE